jgi:hypothetical protein
MLASVKHSSLLLRSVTEDHDFSPFLSRGVSSRIRTLDHRNKGRMFCHCAVPGPTKEVQQLAFFKSECQHAIKSFEL